MVPSKVTVKAAAEASNISKVETQEAQGVNDATEQKSQQVWYVPVH